MAGIKIVDLPPLGRDLASTDLLELSLAGGTGSRKITGQEIMNASKLSINNTPIINGTVGRVLFQGTGDVLQQSSSLTFNDTTKAFLLSGNQNNTTLFTISNTTAGTLSNPALQLISDNSAGQAQVFKYSSTRTPYKSIEASDFGHYNATAGDISFLNDVVNGKIKFATNQSNTAQMTLAASGNVLINTTTDSGFRLDVNGTARVQGLTTIRTLASSYNSPLIVENTGSAAVDNKNVATFIGARGNASNIDDNTNIGIWQKSNIVNNYGVVNFFNSLGNLSAYFGAQFVNHGASPTGNLLFGTVQNGAPSTRMTIFNTGNVGINTTTDDGFKLDVNGTARVSGPSIVRVGGTNSNISLFTVDITQSAAITPGNSTPKGLVVAGTYNDTNVGNNTIYQPLFSVETLISSTTSAYSGVSRNLINLSPSMESIGRDLNNNTTIINVTPSFTFRNVNNITGFLYNPTFTLSGSNNTHRAIHTVTGNVLLGSTSGNVLIGTTTDAGFKFDVNGTARVSSTGNVLTINDSSNSRNFTFNPSYATSTYGGFFNHSTGNITLGASLGTDNGSNLGIFLGGPAGNRNASALLQIDSTSRGFLPPRMTQAQRNAIASPAIGLEIYQTDATEGKYIYKSSGWTYIG